MNASKNAPKTSITRGYFWEITASGPDEYKSQVLAELNRANASCAVFQIARVEQAILEPSTVVHAQLTLFLYISGTSFIN